MAKSMEVKEELGAFDEEVPVVWKSACTESEWMELERPSLAQQCKMTTYKLRSVLVRRAKWKSARRDSEGNIVPMIVRTT